MTRRRIAATILNATIPGSGYLALRQWWPAASGLCLAALCATTAIEYNPAGWIAYAGLGCVLAILTASGNGHA